VVLLIRYCRLQRSACKCKRDDSAEGLKAATPPRCRPEGCPLHSPCIHLSALKIKTQKRFRLHESQCREGPITKRERQREAFICRPLFPHFHLSFLLFVRLPPSTFHLLSGSYSPSSSPLALSSPCRPPLLSSSSISIINSPSSYHLTSQRPLPLPSPLCSHQNKQSSSLFPHRLTSPHTRRTMHGLEFLTRPTMGLALLAAATVLSSVERVSALGQSRWLFLCVLIFDLFDLFDLV